MRYFEPIKTRAVAFASVGCLALTVCPITIWLNPTIGDAASLILLVVLASLFLGGFLLCLICLLLKPISRGGIVGFVGVLVACWTIVYLYLLSHSYPYSLGTPY